MENRGRRIALSGLAALLVLGACSGDDDSDDGTTVITDPVETSETTDSTPSTTTTTIDPDAEVKAEVEEAYLAYWDAFLVIFKEPRPDNPLVEAHTTEAVRQATLDGITQLVLDGQSLQPPEDPGHFAATVLEIDVDGERAQVEACLIDGARLIQNATSEVLNDDVVTKHIQAEVAIEDAQWKVAQSRVVERREGVWNCES